MVTIAEMISKARSRDGSSTEVRNRLLLGLLEVGVGAGGVVGDVDDLVDLGDGLPPPASDNAPLQIVVVI